jgi:hypothetical protein
VVYRPLPARTTILQVLEADGTTWTEIEGVNLIGTDPSANEVMVDKGTYGHDGHASNIKTQVGATISVDYLKYVDSVTGAQAPGQLRLQTLAEALLWDGIGQVRIRDELDTVWKRWPEATFSSGMITGDKNALRAGGFTISRNLPSVTEAVA